MITAKLQGGLGNQLFQIAAAQSLAWKLGVKAVFDLDKCSTDNQGHKASKYKDTIYRKLETGDTSSCVNVYNEPHFHYKPLPLTDNQVLDGYFQSYKYFSEYSDSIKKIFNDYIYPPVFPGEKFTAVHVRRGDYLNFPDTYTLLPKEYYESAMKLFPGSLFVFISDDIEWCKNNFRGPNILFSVYDDIADFNLIRGADNVIMANSSFSWCGAWLNTNNNKKIIAPANWFKPRADHNTKDLYCNSWIIL